MPTYDVHITATSDPSLKPMSFGYKAAVSVTGAMKVINRWIKCFLTPKGSDHSDYNYGTGFTSILGGNVADVQDLLDQVSGFLDDCNTQMRAMDRRNLPVPDEQFGSATITKVLQIDAADYAIWVTVKSATGAAAVVVLPTVSA